MIRVCSILLAVALNTFLPTLDAFIFQTNPLISTKSSHRIAPSTFRYLASTSSSVVDRLELSDNFNRWRFLQNFLDGEIEASDANEVLYSVLDSFLKYPPPDSSEVVSPLATSDVRGVIEGLLNTNDGAIPAFQDPECTPGDDDVLQQLELLLPDPRENEDAFKGSWDTVIELHGREAVKINEGKCTSEWKALCMVARVLIYFDFMARGVPTRPTQ